MRTATMMFMIALAVLALCQPAIPGSVTVYRLGRSFTGWFDEKGKIIISNDSGRTIMTGQVSKMGGVELEDLSTGEDFVGKVNPMGNGRVTSPRSGDSFRIEIER